MNDFEELASMTKDMTLLYVEDNDITRIAIMGILEELFDDIIVAVDGQEGLNEYEKYLKENQKYFDLIICDMNMPKLDGSEMLKKIIEYNHSQKAIVITGYNNPEKIQKLIDIGVEDYINKPLKLDQLMSKIENTAQSFKSKN